MANKKPVSEVPDRQLPDLAKKMLWADDPTKVSKLIKYLIFLCVALFLLDFIIHRHAYFSFEQWYGFYAFAGFAAFTLIVLAAKQLRRLILRSENYYAPHAVDSEAYPEQGLQQVQHGENSTAKAATAAGSDGSN